jgi:hypothetical protein
VRGASTKRFFMVTPHLKLMGVNSLLIVLSQIIVKQTTKQVV